MICECCQKEHSGTYGSGRFCGVVCARSFSTKSKRKEINEKVSRKVSGRSHSRGFTGKRKEFTAADREKSVALSKEKAYDNLINTDYVYLSKYQLYKKIRLEQNYTCLHCNNSEWLGQKLY